MKMTDEEDFVASCEDHDEDDDLNGGNDREHESNIEDERIYSFEGKHNLT